MTSMLTLTKESSALHCRHFVSIPNWRQFSLINPLLFVLSISSQLLCLWNRACLGVPARTEHRVPRLEAGKSAPGQGWPSEDYRLWIRQEAQGSHLDAVWHPRVFSPRDYSVKRTQQSCGLVGVRWVLLRGSLNGHIMLVLCGKLSSVAGVYNRAFVADNSIWLAMESEQMLLKSWCAKHKSHTLLFDFCSPHIWWLVLGGT